MSIESAKLALKRHPCEGPACDLEKIVCGAYGLLDYFAFKLAFLTWACGREEKDLEKQAG